MVQASKTNRSWTIGIIVLLGVLTANAMVGLVKSKMPATTDFLAEVERCSGLHRDDLAVAGGGCGGGWLGRSAYMNFWVAKHSGRLIHIELTRPLHVLDWRLAKFSDGWGGIESRIIGKWETAAGTALEFFKDGTFASGAVGTMTGLAVSTRGTWAMESGDRLKLIYDTQLYREVYAEDQRQVLEISLDVDGLKLGGLRYRRIEKTKP